MPNLSVRRVATIIVVHILLAIAFKVSISLLALLRSTSRTKHGQSPARSLKARSPAPTITMDVSGSRTQARPLRDPGSHRRRWHGEEEYRSVTKLRDVPSESCLSTRVTRSPTWVPPTNAKPNAVGSGGSSAASPRARRRERLLLHRLVLCFQTRISKKQRESAPS